MTSKEKGIWNNKPFWCILLFGLAVLCSSIKVLVLPQGGSLTYFSLMILWLMTFIYGPRYGLIASVLFGFVRLGIPSDRRIYQSQHLVYPIRIPDRTWCFLSGWISTGTRAKERLYD